jgi:hypothetical protein
LKKGVEYGGQQRVQTIRGHIFLTLVAGKKKENGG